MTTRTMTNFDMRSLEQERSGNVWIVLSAATLVVGLLVLLTMTSASRIGVEGVGGEPDAPQIVL